MKWFIVLLLPTFSFAVACPSGSSEYQGSCVIDIQPSEQVGFITKAAWISDEKPPKTTTGEWQTGKFEIVTLRPESTVDDEIAAAKKWDDAHGQPHRGMQ